MSLQFFRNAALLLMMITPVISAAVLSDGLQRGKNYYFAGEFKKAISQFQLTIQANPNDAEPYLWLGKSYALLGDINAPMWGVRARSKARMYLTKATQLAPDCAECRRELFSFLVDSDESRSALRQAQALLERVPESDPDLPWMQFLLMEAHAERSSPEYVTGVLLTLPSQALARLSVRPVRVLREPGR